MKKIILILFGLITLAAIPVTIYFVQQRQNQLAKASPATTLSFKPATVTTKVGDTVTLEAQIETDVNEIYVGEFHISYDPTKLEALSIVNGPMFPNVLISGTIDPTGRLSITLGAANQATPVSGSGIAVIVKFKALAVTTSPVTVQFISPDTFVGAKGEGATNVLIGSVPAKISVTLDGTTNTPTPTQRTTPSPTVTTTPGTSPQPTSVSTPTPSVTGTLGGSPQPTPSRTPTATVTPTGQAAQSLLITEPASNQQMVQNEVIISGTGPANTSITLTIYSSPQTAVVTSNASGVWSHTPNPELSLGPHDIVASAVDPITGTNLTATRSFVVVQSGSSTATPVSGSVSTTFLIIGIACILIGSGLLLPVLKP